MNSCFIGLGSNLGQPQRQLQAALDAMDKLPETQLIKVSSLYSSKPMGPQNQPDYVNAVAQISTRLTPQQLLEQLQNIENQQGRERLERWGARTLDLDILLYDKLQLSTERLTIPHVGIKLRDFVLVPLAEIAPDLTLPDGSHITQLVQDCPSYGLQKAVFNTQ